MKRLLLIATTFLFIGGAANASTIVTVTCSAAGIDLTQSGPDSASCDAKNPPLPGEAAANGTVSLGALYGFTAAQFNGLATSYSSFDPSFSDTTTLSWDINIGLEGSFGYILLELGPVQEYYQKFSQGTGEYFVTETLVPGNYTFSAYSYTSDEGGASVNANSSTSSTAPEPATFVLAGPVLLFGLISARKMPGFCFRPADNLRQQAKEVRRRLRFSL